MHKILVYVAFGWLTFAGSMHFVVDVLSQYLRNKRVPSAETSLYYAFNSAFALSQVLLALITLFVARRSLELITAWPMLLITTLAIAAWFALAFLFIEYREPKIVLTIFTVLFVAMLATGLKQ